MKPVPERIARKDQVNDCTLYEFRTTIEKDTAPSAPPSGNGSAPERATSRPLDARQALKTSLRNSRDVLLQSGLRFSIAYGEPGICNGPGELIF